MSQTVSGPSWMDPVDWEARVAAYIQQRRSTADIAEIARHLEARGPRQPKTRESAIARARETGTVDRALYVPRGEESRFAVRDENGLPSLRLVDSGDRLSIWSPVDGGALLNPKGPWLCSYGLVTTYARGTEHHSAAFTTAELRKGSPVDLRADPDNPFDANAVAMFAERARRPFGYVQRGKVSGVSKRLQAGVNLVGVSLRGPDRGQDNDTAFVLIGTREDLETMIEAASRTGGTVA